MELLYEVTVSGTVGTVWRALRDPAEIRRWFGWDYDGLDAEIQQIFKGEATEGDDRRSLQIGGHRFILDETGDDQVTIGVERSGPAGDDAEEIERGWLTFLQQLRFALARRPGADRHTVFVEGGCEPVKGDEWFRSSDQVGVVVEGWGPGLLIVTPTMAIATTYGLDDAARAEVERQLRG